METPDTLRYTKIPLNNGSGAMPAVGFGALIPDPVAWAVQRGTGFLVPFARLPVSKRTLTFRACLKTPCGRFAMA
jgi:hypothetical protein